MREQQRKEKARNWMVVGAVAVAVAIIAVVLVVISGNNDTTGALRAIEIATTGLRWREVQAPISVIGSPTSADLESCWELGAAVAAGLALD